MYNLTVTVNYEQDEKTLPTIEHPTLDDAVLSIDEIIAKEDKATSFYFELVHSR